MNLAQVRLESNGRGRPAGDRFRPQGVGPGSSDGVNGSGVSDRIIGYNPDMDRIFFMAGATSALLGVGAGAFGAHMLRDRLPAEMLVIYETAARYQMYHAFALLAAAWAQVRWPGSAVRWAGWLFVVGTVIFSGSLYALSLTGVRMLGAITPFGGMALLAGWFCLVASAWRGQG